MLGLAILFQLKGEKPGKYKLDGTQKKKRLIFGYMYHNSPFQNADILSTLAEAVS